MKARRNIDAAFIGLFALLLVAPVLGKAFDIRIGWKIGENRKLADFPKIELTGAALRTFPPQFDKYFTDNFRFRNVLISTNSLLKTMIMRTSPNKLVVFGSGGWLYFAADDASIYKKKLLFSGEELKERERIFGAIVELFAKANMRFYMMIVPEKQTVYNEGLPLYLRDLNHDSRFLQFMHYIEKGKYGKSLIDIFSDLNEEKNKGRYLYYKTDSHWNDLGAMVAYMRMMKVIQPNKELVYGRDIASMDIQVKSYSGDLAQMAGLQPVISEKSPFIHNRPMKADVERYESSYEGIKIARELFASQDPDRAGDGVVMIRDSQARPMIPWMASSFSRSVFVDIHEESGTMLQIISKVRPAIVIYEVVERAWESDLDRFDHCAMATP